ncbi:transposase [Spiroplasma ixodetis]|uniref:Transposase n=1 Tax=Spiroplasma ixodetis TaxID=2141 RepID=A0ABN6SX32_9MOLU|nr:transposase [Spiroplasma ixodetis]BDT03127.1 hypothetical protein SHM_07730 [Spiroplasma ixodetis]
MTNINSYTDEFKKQIVALYQSGKSVSCLAKEYNVTRAATYKWIKQFTNELLPTCTCGGNNEIEWVQ